MIRFAPQSANIATPLKVKVEIPADEPATATGSSEGLAESGMLLAEFPVVSSKITKTRSPRKPKAKPEATAVQLDLNAQTTSPHQ